MRVFAKIDKHKSQCKTKFLSLLTFVRIVINWPPSYWISILWTSTHKAGWEIWNKVFNYL